MPSSPITPASTVPDTPSLLAALGRVPDPRDPRGVRYPLAGVLAVAVCAVLTGARSFAAIGEWALDLRSDQLARLGLERAPVESTLRKLFARLDAAALDRQLAVIAWTRTRQVEGRRVIAIDGKTVRGARTATSTAPHLVAALDHATGVVLGQNAVAAKSNEIPAVRDLLASFDPVDLHGCVITVDALCRPRHKASYGDLLVMPTWRPEAPVEGGVRGGVVGITSQALEEGDGGVGGLVAAWRGVEGSGPGECLFFDGEVGVDVDLGGGHALVA